MEARNQYLTETTGSDVYQTEPTRSMGRAHTAMHLDLTPTQLSSWEEGLQGRGMERESYLATFFLTT